MLLPRHFLGSGFDISLGPRYSDRGVSDKYKPLAGLSTFIPWLVEPMGVPCMSMIEVE